MRSPHVFAFKCTSRLFKAAHGGLVKPCRAQHYGLQVPRRDHISLYPFGEPLLDPLIAPYSLTNPLPPLGEGHRPWPVKGKITTGMAMGMLRSMFRCSKQKPDRGAALPTPSSWIYNSSGKPCGADLLKILQLNFP